MLKERKEEEEAQPQTHANGASSSNGERNVPLDEQLGESSSTGVRRRHRRWPTGGSVEKRTLSINPLAPSTAFDETLKHKLNETQKSQNSAKRQPSEERDGGNLNGDLNGTPSGDDRIMVRDWAAPPGKRISVPVRIEPKVYFAAERTFLKWLNTAVFVGTIATTLLNFVPADDPRGLISAAFFTLAALLAIAYSAGIFVYRSYMLRSRRASGLYYDKYGPTILCVIIFLALATNVGLRMSDM